MMKHKECCCCGEAAGRWQQWWNRDTGYGVCMRCVAWTEGRNRERGWSEQEIKAETRDLYGIEGQHYGQGKCNE
jgi:hypothetical protein